MPLPLRWFLFGAPEKHKQLYIGDSDYDYEYDYVCEYEWKGERNNNNNKAKRWERKEIERATTDGVCVVFGGFFMTAFGSGLCLCRRRRRLLISSMMAARSVRGKVSLFQSIFSRQAKRTHKRKNIAPQRRKNTRNSNRYQGLRT